MALPIWPTSPLPAALTRLRDWNETVIQYDSGAQQADSPYYRPLFNWGVKIDVMNEIKEGTLSTFVTSLKGMTRPFLIKDPYIFGVNSVLAVRSGITNAATLYFYDLNSYQLRPDSLTVGSLFSVLSGYVRLGVEYSLDQDSGIVTVNTKATTDVWGARSFEYYRKARFVQKFSETGPVWNIFGADMTIQELP